jgi:23S rRNA (uracil1939-C5)-methyltransferase
MAKPAAGKPPSSNWLRKNSMQVITIDDVTGTGHGVGHIPGTGDDAAGFTVFVEGALPGDRARVKLTRVKTRYAYANLVNIITPSPHRAKPGPDTPNEWPCPVAARCGGCQWQHCEYTSQLLFKRSIVQEALKRIGGVEDPLVLTTMGMENPFGYRCKAQFPVGMPNNSEASGGMRGNAVFGFYASRSHRIVPFKRCLIQHPAHTKVLAAIQEYLQKYNVPIYDEETHTGLVRHVLIRASLHTGEVMAALVLNGRELPYENELVSFVSAAGVTTMLLNINTARTNVVLAEESRVLSGDGYIRERIGDIIYRISLNAFFQINPPQARVLYDIALDYGAFTGTETVIDAHAGVGGIALYAARSIKRVYGVEIVQEAADGASFNAMANQIKNASFINGTAEEVVPALLTGSGPWSEKPVHANAIFLDPPRKGCEKELLDAIIAARVSKVIYISCEPATLARDVCILAEGGYIFETAQPVDMFPMTGKVETVALLRIKRSS